MGFNTFPCNPYPISTDELNKGNNDDLNARVATLEEDVTDLSSQKANQITIAPAFNSETSYEVGDLVYYNGLSYRCTNEHSGEWDADDFTGTTIANEIAEVKSDIGMPDYSTTEQLTGQKWIDGKDIYFKVINTAVAIEQIDTWYSTGLSGVDKVINYFPRLTRDGEQIGDTFNNGHLDYVVRNNDLLVKGVGFTLTDNYVIVTQTIYYTKTTI